MKKKVLIAMGTAVIVVSGVLLTSFQSSSNSGKKRCMLTSYICPDGSYGYRCAMQLGNGNLCSIPKGEVCERYICR